MQGKLEKIDIKEYCDEKILLIPNMRTEEILILKSDMYHYISKHKFDKLSSACKYIEDKLLMTIARTLEYRF